MKKTAAEDTTDEDMREDPPIPLATHVNKTPRSFFLNVEAYINIQQIYNSNGLYAHKFYNSDNFQGPISFYKGALHSEGFDSHESCAEIMDARLSEPFLTRRMKMPSRPHSFMLYGKLGVEISPIRNCYMQLRNLGYDQ